MITLEHAVIQLVMVRRCYHYSYITDCPISKQDYDGVCDPPSALLQDTKEIAREAMGWDIF